MGDKNRRKKEFISKDLFGKTIIVNKNNQKKSIQTTLDKQILFNAKVMKVKKRKNKVALNQLRFEIDIPKNNSNEV